MTPKIFKNKNRSLKAPISIQINFIKYLYNIVH